MGAGIREEWRSKMKGPAGGHRFIEVVPGRAAILQCWGPEGRVQIGMVYLPTGNSGGRAERMAAITQLTTEMLKGGHALNIVTGDFNYDPDKWSRFSGESPDYTGDGDAGEARSMETQFKRLELRELEQEAFTYRFEGCRSRLDRVYTNLGRHD